ncbi:hypothetical protein WEH80_34210 [Actinomycetes bacterium KLBMP 9759]
MGDGWTSPVVNLTLPAQDPHTGRQSWEHMVQEAATQEIPVIGGRVRESTSPIDRTLHAAIVGIARIARRTWPTATVASIIAAFGFLGALIAADLVEFRSEWRFDLDGEGNVTATFSAVLLVCAGLILLVCAVSIRYIPLGMIGALLTYMAFDEVFSIHESFEIRTGIGWQTLYLPIAAVAGIAALLIVERLRRARLYLPLWALVAGGTSWVVAQLLEKLEWEGDVPQPGYAAMMVSEEILEMVGTFAFMIAGFALATAVTREYLLPPRHRRTR